MARIRTIKPEFWTSEQVVECSTTVRLLFIGTWNFCDDGGVHPYSLKRLKLQIFPGDSFTDQQMRDMVAELLQVKLLRSFTVDDHRYLYVSGWRHQKIEKPNYRWPQPNADTVFDDESPTSQQPVDDQSTTIHPRNGMDVSSSEGNGVLNCATGSAPPAGSHDAQFCKFWGIFPRKRRKSRGEAFKKWQAARKAVSAETLITAAEEYAASPEGRGDFVKMPSTWLNKECWNDDREAWNQDNRSQNGKTPQYANQRCVD